RWIGVALAWVGSGAMVSWSLYLAMVLMTPNDFRDVDISFADVGAELVRLVAGVVVAWTALSLVRRRAERTGAEVVIGAATSASSSAPAPAERR
ncbi:MAG: hypothetical protein L0H93_23330, partial [Nocardioides sp.]|nr:hypothetical protein [Nocardioides sp.]